MFTGLVECTATVTEVKATTLGRQCRFSSTFSDLSLGESISIDGICLTVTEFDEKSFCCTLSSETLNVTTAHFWQVGSLVNLERSMQMNARFGGHFVLGHVDGTCQLTEKSQSGECWEYEIALLDPNGKNYLVPKGSVTLNGVSLTINERTARGFKIMLIPHTLSVTNLSRLCPGDFLNIEFDYLVKAIKAAPIQEDIHV